jgi:hypothetical protein
MESSAESRRIKYLEKKLARAEKRIASQEALIKDDCKKRCELTIENVKLKAAMRTYREAAEKVIERLKDRIKANLSSELNKICNLPWSL